MRFSTRDLLWLMAVVALAATIYAERVQMRRMQAKWVVEKAKIEEDTAAELAAMSSRVKSLRHENALLSHQLVVQMEKEQRRDEVTNRDQDAATPSRFRRPQPVAPTFGLPDAAAK